MSAVRFRVPRATLISEHLITNLGLLILPLVLEVTELRKVDILIAYMLTVKYTYSYNVIKAKGYKPKSAKNKRHRVKSGKIPNTKLPCLQGGSQSIAKPQSPPELTVQFLLEFHYVVMVD